MNNEILKYLSNQCCYKFKIYKDKELEQIESIEDEDGTIRKRFVIKGFEDGPIFEEPRKQPLSLDNSFWYNPTATNGWSNTIATGTTITIGSTYKIYNYWK